MSVEFVLFFGVVGKNFVSFFVRVRISSSTRMYGHTHRNMDQPGKVANLACGQLNRENEYFPVRVRA